MADRNLAAFPHSELRRSANLQAGRTYPGDFFHTQNLTDLSACFDTNDATLRSRDSESAVNVVKLRREDA